MPTSTRRLLGNAFKLRELGRRELKGLAEPVEAWAVEGVSGFESRFELMRGVQLSGFVGREAEIGLLMDRCNLARDGDGQVVLLSGEPGIGKSRILNELRGRLEKERVASLPFQCSPYYVNSAFYPIIDNFERSLKFGRDETADGKLDKLEALIVGDYGRPREDVRFIASTLSIPCEERYGAVTMTPQRFKDETLRALVDTVEAAARKQPTVMFFEDAHWADPTSLETIDLLVDRVARVPLLVVLTHRLEFQSRWSHYSHVTALTLTRLTRAQSSALVLRLTGGKTLPRDLLEQILNKTDGVPLFVEELTKSILESSGLADAGDHYIYSGNARSIAIPLSLRDSLMSRLDRFMPVKEAAQIGAAIGHRFSYELIAAVAPHAGPDLDQALSQLTASGLAFRQGTPPDAFYSFKHALVRNAAYESLLKSRRQELHGKIARVIQERFPAVADKEPELLAEHYTQASQFLSAIPLWRKAGELALVRMALTESISHLNRGLELIQTLSPSSERDASELALRIPLGTAWLALKGWAVPEVWNSLHPALALAKSLRHNEALLPIHWGLQFTVLNQGRAAESLHWVNETLDAAAATGDPDLQIAGHTLATAYFFWTGRLTKSIEQFDQVLALYHEDKHRRLANLLNHDPRTIAGIYASVCVWLLGYPNRAMRMLEDTHAHARRRAHPWDLGWALAFPIALDFPGAPEQVRKDTDECVQLGRDNSLPVLSAMMAPLARGIALVRGGKAFEGIGQLNAGLTFWDASDGKLWSPYGKAVLAEAKAHLGDLDGAMEVIETQIAQIECPGWEERICYAEVLRLKGWILSLKRDLEDAERSYLASLDWARHQQAKSWELRTATSYVRLMREQGRTGEAYELLAPIYAWFTEGFDTKDLKDAKAMLDELR